MTVGSSQDLGTGSEPRLGSRQVHTDHPFVSDEARQRLRGQVIVGTQVFEFLFLLLLFLFGFLGLFGLGLLGGDRLGAELRAPTESGSS